MILEGIVTTLDGQGRVNIAPMGPIVPDDYPGSPLVTFTLLPFRTSRTHANLTECPEGVLHVSDDVLLLARAAIGEVDPLPPLSDALEVRGRILAEACRAYEFRVVACDGDPKRERFGVEVVRTHRLRDAFGFNRAKFAVLEAAILATRVHLLPAAEIEADFARLVRLVEKTGGPREAEAFALLRRYVSENTR
jgi:hypothetical protein